MKKEHLPSLFENPLVSNLIAPIGGRAAVRKLLFGSGVAALTLLGEAPGVSAASLGYQGVGQVRLLQLTGKALAKELAHLEALPEFHRAASLLKVRGFSQN
ncbi:MAG: hypothetical protein IRZ31_20165 [Thermogemmatispora sp.]|uniref:hypothetical protein n=1 Tax=Thermogemmatispora sp. TaxID=1968838 RepID=UPI002615052C|nr:hypothetical protein [Thermogemmatispora sp.]MBX5459215.1 hypothetical protein [Thermogemmatispora sp.]